MENEQILTIEEAAKVLKVSVSFLYKLTMKKSLPCFRVGKKVRFQRDLLLAHFGYATNQLK